MDFYKFLETEECCYTCQNNRNKLSKNFPCNCLFKNHSNVTLQDLWCEDYEMCEEYSDNDEN